MLALTAVMAVTGWLLLFPPWGLTIKDVERIRPGMTTEQVELTLGKANNHFAIAQQNHISLESYTNWYSIWNVRDGYIHIHFDDDRVVATSTMAYPKWRKVHDELWGKLGWPIDSVHFPMPSP